MSNLSTTELIQHTTVRLECTLINGATSVGTGFYFAFEKNENSWNRLVIVTNKHVVRDSTDLTIYLTPFDNNKNPNYSANFSKTIYIKESDWIPHPEDEVDLCILPFDKFHDNLIESVGDFFIEAYNKEDLADAQKSENLSAIDLL